MRLDFANDEHVKVEIKMQIKKSTTTVQDVLSF